MKKAFLKSEKVSRTGAIQRHYLLEGGENIVVSALPSAFDTGRPETYIFPCDEQGEITDWLELSGSFRGSLDFKRALAGHNDGYQEEALDLVAIEVAENIQERLEAYR